MARNGENRHRVSPSVALHLLLWFCASAPGFSLSQAALADLSGEAGNVVAGGEAVQSMAPGQELQRQLLDQAVAFRNSGELSKAEIIFRKSLDVDMWLSPFGSKIIGLQDDDFRATVLVEWGHLNSEMGLNEVARQAFQTALPLADKSDKGMWAEAISARNGLATVHLHDADPKAAYKVLVEARSLCDRYLDEFHPLTVETNNNIHVVSTMLSLDQRTDGKN